MLKYIIRRTLLIIPILLLFEAGLLVTRFVKPKKAEEAADAQ